MRFDRTSESYSSRALTAELLADQYAREGDRQWARVWRKIADDMRALAVQIATVRPAAEMAVVA